MAITNLCQLVFIFFCAHTAVQIVSFKNSPTNYCCFGTSTASPWAKATFLHMYLFYYAIQQDVMEEEHTKEPSHNNPVEAAQYVKDVSTLLQTFEKSIHGFDRYAQQDAYEIFLHSLSQLLSKLDSAYLTKMNIDIILDTIPDKVCATFLAHPEEAANRVQQCVSSDSIPLGPEVTSKM